MPQKVREEKLSKVCSSGELFFAHFFIESTWEPNQNILEISPPLHPTFKKPRYEAGAKTSANFHVTFLSLDPQRAIVPF